MPIWPQFHCPLSIDIDSGSGESMYYGHVLVFFGVNENSKMALIKGKQSMKLFRTIFLLIKFLY